MTASNVRFYSPAELRAMTPEAVSWIWRGYIARGAVTLLQGHPKGGKSTLACALAESIAAETGTFAGRPTHAGPVVYLTEEDRRTALLKLEHDALRLVTRDTLWPKPEWPELIDRTRNEAQQAGAQLVVFDTWHWWAGLGPDQENDQGATQSALNQLHAITNDDVAVLLLGHTRKATSDNIALNNRGSSAISGVVDVIAQLDRSNDGATYRRLTATGRWPDQVPPTLTVRRDAASGLFLPIGHREIVEGQADALETDARLLAAAVATQPGLSQKKLRDGALNWGDTRFRPALEHALRNGLVANAGTDSKHEYVPPCSNGSNTVGTRHVEPTVSGGAVPTGHGLPPDTDRPVIDPSHTVEHVNGNRPSMYDPNGDYA